MNKKQKKLLIIVSIVLILMFLFPPWHGGRSAALKYSLFFLRPRGASSVYIGMLFMQYLFVITIGGIFYFLLKDNNGNKIDEMTKGEGELSENSEKENMINE